MLASTRAWAQTRAVFHRHRDSERRLVVNFTTTDGAPRQFTFPPWSEFLQQEATRNGELAYFRYRITARRADGSWHPTGARRLKVVRLSDGVELGDFAPGVGGEFHWLHQTQIVMRSGCGSNCYPYTVFETSGARLVSHIPSGTAEVVADRYIVDFPCLDYEPSDSDHLVAVYDFETLMMRRYHVPLAYLRIWPESFSVNDRAFIIHHGEGGRITLPIEPRERWTPIGRR